MIINNAKKPLNPPVLTVKNNYTRDFFGAFFLFYTDCLHFSEIFRICIPEIVSVTY